MPTSAIALGDLDVGALRAAELTSAALRIAAEQGRLAGLQAQIAARLAEAAAKPPADDDDWLDAATAAAHLGVPKSWIRDRARRGVLRSHRFGRYVRFRRAELDEDATRISERTTQDA